MKPKRKNKQDLWLRAINNRIRWAEGQKNSCEFWADFAHELKRVRMYIQDRYRLEDMKNEKEKA